MVVLRPATATPLPPAAPVARHTGLTGHAPPWAKTVAVGVLFAGVVAAFGNGVLAAGSAKPHRPGRQPRQAGFFVCKGGRACSHFTHPLHEAVDAGEGFLDVGF